ncbi:MAG: hypothetical protein ABI831_06500 [Betaproteobacteria bacterium]
MESFAPAGIVMDPAVAFVLTVIVKLLQIVTSSPAPGTLAPVAPVQLVADQIDVALQLPFARPKRFAAWAGKIAAQTRAVRTSSIAVRRRCMQEKVIVIRLKG